MAAGAAPPPVRGFVVERGDGRPQLPGSLHVNRRLDRWLSFAEPGVVVAFTGKAELGQGILTALRLIVAEELDVPIDAVRIMPASTARGPDEGVTSGSLSVQDGGGALRHACAEVRGMARARAAARAGAAVGTAGATDAVQAARATGTGAADGPGDPRDPGGPGDPIRVVDGRFVHADGRVLGDYWTLLSDTDLAVEYAGRHAPKPPGRRTLLGRARPPRVDLPDKVFGRPRYVHDLRLPGMLHGRVLRAPSLRARLASPPDAAIAALPSGVRAFVDGGFVAIVAATSVDADRAAARLRDALAWTGAPALPDAHALPAYLRAAPHEASVVAERGDATLPEGGTVLAAEYFKPYLAHASIGPSCAVAHWDDGRLEVWTHSQGIHNLRDDLAKALPDVPRERIVVHHVEGAGCYGHNGADDVACDAALLAVRCPGAPVRVAWSRADELAHAPFGSAHLVALHARVDDAGRITHWRHAHWSNGYSSRPGRAPVPALLGASQREGAPPLPLPIDPPTAAGGGSQRNAVPGYAVPNLRVTGHRLLEMPLRTSAMRALGAFANVFAIESFVDELAGAVGEDPLAFRLRHLADDARARAVLETVVARSRWWRDARPEGVGRGLAWARYKLSGAWCAVLARVRVGESVRVLDLDLAVDVGTVVDRDGVVAQIEGGAVQATSWTLKEQVAFDRDGVTSTGWASYPVLRFTEVPRVTVHVIDRPDEPSLGAGEAAQGPVAAALGNAVADALGVRVRRLPLTTEHLLQAIHADGEGA